VPTVPLNKSLWFCSSGAVGPLYLFVFFDFAQ